MSEINWIVAEDKKPETHGKFPFSPKSRALLAVDSKRHILRNVAYFNNPEKQMVGFHAKYGNEWKLVDDITHWTYVQELPLPAPVEKLETL